MSPPTSPAGRIEVPEAIAHPSSDIVTIRVNGVGTHGASPHLGIDPVLIASPDRRVAPVDRQPQRSTRLIGRVITVGAIHGGVRGNIIPEHVDLALTVRADTPEVRTQLLDGIDRVARGTALAIGVPQDRLPVVTRSTTETTPPTINHARDGPSGARPPSPPRWARTA